MKINTTFFARSVLFVALCVMGLARAESQVGLCDNREAQVTNTYLTTDDKYYYKVFEVDVPEANEYYMSFWALPVKYFGGSYTTFSIFVDGEFLESYKPERGNWQSIVCNSRIPLPTGTHAISIATLAPEIPTIETVKISFNKSLAALSGDDYENFLDISRNDNVLTACTPINAEMPLSLTNNFGNVIENVPVLYTFYDTFKFVKGEYVKLVTSSVKDHIMDVFFLGHPLNKVLPFSEASVSDFVGESTNDFLEPTEVFKVFKYACTAPTSEEMQGLNWKFISEKSSNSSLQTINKYMRVPVTGYYIVRITTAVNLESSVVNFNMNDTFFYEDVPITYYGVENTFPANLNPYVVMTKSETDKVDDPMIFVHGADADRVVGFSDDASILNSTNNGLTSWDAYLSQKYLVATNAISISSFSSLTPISTCKLIYDLENNLLQKAPSKVGNSNFTRQNCLDKGTLIEGDLSLNGFLSFNSTEKLKRISIYTIEGLLLKILSPNESQLTIKVNEMNITTPGLYIVKTETDSEVKSQKLMIR